MTDTITRVRDRSRQFREYARGPEGTKMLRYSMTSLIALGISVVCLAILNGPVGMSAWLASTLATAVSAVASYHLNRRWCFGKEGKSHVLKEVVPFWVVTFLGWGLATVSVHLMESYAKSQGFSHLARTGTVVLVYVAAFGVLWVGKYVFFNRVLFARREAELVAARVPVAD